jgi:hypothetical protein
MTAKAPARGQADRSTITGRLTTIAVVVPTALVADPKGRPFVVSCLESLLSAARNPGSAGSPTLAEIVLVTQGQALDDPVVEAFANAGVQLRQLDVLGPFNFSKKVNAGVAHATSDVVFLLNDDAQVTSLGWPAVLSGLLEDEQVGAVGPIVLNPDGTLNSAGDAISVRGPRHIGAFDVRHRPGLSDSLASDRDVSLLTGAAFAVRRSVYQMVDGFDERYPTSYGDVDFCLRLGKSGHRLVCTPRFSVVHRESSSRDPRVDPATLRRLLVDHPDILRDDPLLPPPTFPMRLRVTRTVGPVVRSVYRATIRRAVPTSLRERLSGVIDRRGWIP